ncbi:MAG: hypothetical protein HYX79_05675 [Chloroflexi bacterium]|nr:hypothetical protein [Chloroflexota bacterium]
MTPQVIPFTTTPALAPTSPVALTPTATITQSPAPTPTTIPILPSPRFPPRPEEDILREMVINSDLIVAGTITDLRYEVITVEQGAAAGKQAYTIFTLSVDTVIKGDPATKSVLIRVSGGKIDEKITEGPLDYYFTVSDRVLTCLQRGNDGIYTIPAYGVLWRKGSIINTALDIQYVISRIIQVMRDNNIPVSLP